MPSLVSNDLRTDKRLSRSSFFIIIYLCWKKVALIQVDRESVGHIKKSILAPFIVLIRIASGTGESMKVSMALMRGQVRGKLDAVI